MLLNTSSSNSSGDRQDRPLGNGAWFGSSLMRAIRQAAIALALKVIDLRTGDGAARRAVS